MKKLYATLSLIFIIISCDNTKELSIKKQSSINNPTQTYIINGDIEYISNITDGSKPKKPKLIYNEIKKTISNKISSKPTEGSVKINFNYGISPHNGSGCTLKVYNSQSGQYYITEQNVYGPNPIAQENGYLVRGAGQPHHNFYYNSLVLSASNRGYQFIDTRSGKIFNGNISTASAISIEYPFKANVTYEISLYTYFNDNGLLYPDKVPSNGFPMVYAQLKDTGTIVEGIDACDKDHIIRFVEPNPNYLKTYVLDNNIQTYKTILFKFSPTEEKKALIIAINPKTAESGIDAQIPTNSYTMLLPSVTITEKPFDTSILVPIPPGRR
ncbi:hypothetical protein [Flavobacterium sp. ASV13]|uniref:hypothetical protein n=1 Tax=Flavobacterium sp. ASV13 TaxID=1506583 RepID=UPI00054E9795|nr:hypothetical protein [Flavobacterium sp. ASV13]